MFLFLSCFYQGNRTNYNRVRETEESIPNSIETEDTRLNSEVESSVSSKLQPYSYQVTPQTTDTTSLSSAHTTEYEDAESGVFVNHFSFCCPNLRSTGMDMRYSSNMIWIRWYGFFEEVRYVYIWGLYNDIILLSLLLLLLIFGRYPKCQLS